MRILLSQGGLTEDGNPVLMYDSPSHRLGIKRGDRSELSVSRGSLSAFGLQKQPEQLPYIPATATIPPCMEGWLCLLILGDTLGHPSLQLPNARYLVIGLRGDSHTSLEGTHRLKQLPLQVPCAHFHHPVCRNRSNRSKSAPELPG